MKFPNKPTTTAAIFAATLLVSACSGSSSDSAGTDALPDAEVVPQTTPEIDTPEAPVEPTVETPTAPPVAPPEPPTAPELPIAPVPPVAPPAPVPEPAPPIEQVEIDPTGIIASVVIGDVQGVFLAGTPPESTGSITLAPLSIDGEPIQFISGGSTQIALESDTPFITVFVVVDPEGYFKVDLIEEQIVADLIVSFSTLQLDGELDEIAVSVQNAVGDISGTQVLPVTSVLVGTGELQVSVSWDTPTDVDISLIEPDGTEIFFAAPQSPSGGMLDLDSNPACFIDGVNNENITYEDGTPPSGEYSVSVDYFSDCGVLEPTSFVVTVRIGDSVETFSGTLVPADVFNGPGLVTTFEIQ